MNNSAKTAEANSFLISKYMNISYIQIFTMPENERYAVPERHEFIMKRIIQLLSAVIINISITFLVRIELTCFSLARTSMLSCLFSCSDR